MEGDGAPGRTRTCDILLRRQTLYPTELRAHGWELIQFKAIVEPIATGTAGNYYCQMPGSHVCFHHDDFYPEERAALHLLYVLYACVFWRGEAELLKF